MIRGLRALAAALVAAGLAAEARAQSTLAVGDYALVSSRRVTRTVSEFTYRARLANTTPRTLGAPSASLRSRSPATQVVDGALGFADVAPGASATSLDTFAIRQDRTLPFDPASLAWTVGIRLGGAPGQPALDGFPTLNGESGVPDAEIGEDARGARVARTRLEVELAPGATVAGVNALLADLGASVLLAVEGAGVLLLRIPDPGSVEGVDDVLARARLHDAVGAAHAAAFAEPDLVPDNFDVAQPGGADLWMIDHNLAVRAHAAWNARGALPPVAQRPRVVVGDAFGDGPPDASVDATGLVASDFATGALEPSGHGYHVLGILAASFAGAPCGASTPLTPALARGCATGIFPGTLPIRAVDLQGGLTIPAARLVMIQRMQPALQNTILSTSLNDCSLGTCGDLAVSADQGRIWVTLMRDTGLEERVLHVTSAGNVKFTTPGVTDAMTNSAYTAAALHPALQDLNGDWLARLGNVLVVENARNTVAEPYTAECLSPGSKRGGHLSGIGTDVWSLRDASGTSGYCTPYGICAQEADEEFPTSCSPGDDTYCQAGDLSGTSMATPQVAGLAAYVWSLAPQLTVNDLRYLLLTTMVPVGNGGGVDPCDPTPAEPVIDAYAAVLALDGVEAPPSPSSAPIRSAILDADDDGDFDESDLVLFLSELVQGYFDADTHGPPAAPADRDYGRFDLNGDGFTGGPATARFDLDRVGSTWLGTSQVGRVFAELGDGGAAFEESALTDLEILCHYAWSPMYQGSVAARSEYLDSAAWCNPVRASVDVDGDLEPGTAAPLDVAVWVSNAYGAQWPLDGVHVEIDVVGGSVSDGSGAADAFGVFDTEIVPNEGADELEVTVTVRSAPGGIVLSEESFAHEFPPPPACDYRPAGVYAESRGSVAFGNAGSSYVTATGIGRTIHLVEDADLLRLRTDLPGADAFQYFGPWTGLRARTSSGSRDGISGSASFFASQTSEVSGQSVSIPIEEGWTWDGSTFEGATFSASTTTHVTHSNSGTLQAETSAYAESTLLVSFTVVGNPVTLNVQSEEGFGPGTYYSLTGELCDPEAEELEHDFDYTGDEPYGDPPSTVLLQPGSYSLLISLGAGSWIYTNSPGATDSPDDKDHALEATFTIQ